MNDALAIKNRDIRLFFRGHDLIPLDDDLKISYEKRQIPTRDLGIYVFVHSTKLGVVKVCRVRNFTRFKTFLSESATTPHPKRQLFPGTGSHGKDHLNCYALSAIEAEELIDKHGVERPDFIKKLTRELRRDGLHYDRPTGHVDRTYQTLIKQSFDMKKLKRYVMMDDGSGLTFDWVSDLELTKGYQNALFTQMFNKNIREERGQGSRQVIDMAKQFFNLDEEQLRRIFGAGVHCSAVRVEEFETDRHIFFWREQCNNDFVKRIREHLLNIPDSSDVYPPDVRQVSVCKPSKVMQSTSILVTYYRMVRDGEFGNEKRHSVVSGFIQCRYTGYVWSFKTRNISAFNRVLTQRLGESRNQFALWIMHETIVMREKNGKLENSFEATITTLKNKKLYQSPARCVSERSYRI